MPVVIPSVRVERAVPNGPHAGSAKLIRSRACQELNLRIASPEFGIDRCNDHANFADQIRTHVRGRVGIRTPTCAAACIDAISLHVDRTEGRQAGKAAADSIGIDTDTWH